MDFLKKNVKWFLLASAVLTASQMTPGFVTLIVIILNGVLLGLVYKVLSD